MRRRSDHEWRLATLGRVILDPHRIDLAGNRVEHVHCIEIAPVDMQRNRRLASRIADAVDLLIGWQQICHRAPANLGATHLLQLRAIRPTAIIQAVVTHFLQRILQDPHDPPTRMVVDRGHLPWHPDQRQHHKAILGIAVQQMAHVAIRTADPMPFGQPAIISAQLLGGQGHLPDDDRIGRPAPQHRIDGGDVVRKSEGGSSGCGHRARGGEDNGPGTVPGSLVF
jgi:hypothetical protein